MNSNEITDKLSKYEFEDQFIYTGFKQFNEAIDFARGNNGEIIEVGFLDGNDNPIEDYSANLIESGKIFLADAGPDYKILHSSDSDFQNIAEMLKNRELDLKDKSIEEIYISDSDKLLLEDAVIVLYNNEVESVTSRERSKYLKHTKVYELAVSVSK